MLREYVRYGHLHAAWAFSCMCDPHKSISGINAGPLALLFRITRLSLNIAARS
jgi:hypothetical protein